MRNSKRCPKCAHHEILFVPKLRDSDRDVLAVNSMRISVWSGEIDRQGELQACICRACGFTELYASKPEQIEIDKIPGAQLLVGDPAAPYR